MAKFDGRVTVRIRFRSRPEYEKFRKYILKTEWSYDLDYPMWEQIKMDFHNTDDVEAITRYIISLLQMGFEVYCCQYQMEEHLAAEEHPREEDIPEEDFDEVRRSLWTEHFLRNQSNS